MENIENDLQIESLNLNGSERNAKFKKTKEILDWDKFWTIKEVKMERTWELNQNTTQKKFSFRIDDASKNLTVKQIKKIMKDEYWYYEGALSVSILGKDNIRWTSICTSNDIIHVTLDINKNDEIRKKLEQQWESPYKEMIERQTWKIRYWDRNKPELTLTIDDGNEYKDIKAILNILNEENIKTTFFVKWNRLNFEKDGNNTKELWQMAKKKWHQICCHTYNHIYLSGDSDETILPSSWENSRKDWSSNVKRLLWEKRYKEIEVSEKGKWIDFPKSVSSDVLLETEILMWEAELKNILWEEEWEEYLKKYKRDFPFIRLPWWNWLNREKNIAVLRRLWYLSIYWSDDFLHDRDASGKRLHYSLDEMRVQNWWIPLFHFKWKEEQDYIRQYIQKAKGMGKSFKPLSDVIVPTN